MRQTFAEKTLARAGGLRETSAGQIVDVRPNLVLSHDNSSAIIRIFRELGAVRLRHPERVAIVLDHAVPAPTTQHAANHAAIRRFVAEQGVEHFYDAGRGVCHQMVSENALVWPGQLALGADSHTTHLGWLGAFAAGIGRSEMAAVWATGQLWLRVPESIRIELTGALRPGVTSKDVALCILGEIGAEGAIYNSVEFGGSGLATLSIESRMVLCNMMAECGAKNAYLPSDETVFTWLAARAAERTGRDVTGLRDEIEASALFPDPDATYAARYEIDLGALQPLVARPHSPDNTATLAEVAGTRVQQAFIGTCTNGRLEDLAAAAAILTGPDGRVRQVAPGTRLLIIPASQQVLREALCAGYIDTFVSAGAMIGVPGCGPCMGNHLGVPAPGEVTISSANRNFRGRMGTTDSEIYLASPAVVAASAVAGYITAPDTLLVTGTQAIRLVERRPAPASARAAQHNSVVPDAAVGATLQGRAWTYGDNVNTDAIFPGKYTYTVTDPAEMARHALEDLDACFAGLVQTGDIIVAGRNWGCGSSREQAVTCLRSAGVTAIVAASFARIFFRNAVNNGLLPIACAEAAAAIRPGETVTIDLEGCRVICEAGVFSFPPLSDSLRSIVEAGGLVAMLRSSLEGQPCR